MLTGNNTVHTPGETHILITCSSEAGSQMVLGSNPSIVNAGKGPLRSRKSQSCRKAGRPQYKDACNWDDVTKVEGTDVNSSHQEDAPGANSVF